jgi:hypothetical protein
LTIVSLPQRAQALPNNGVHLTALCAAADAGADRQIFMEEKIPSHGELIDPSFRLRRLKGVLKKWFWECKSLLERSVNPASRGFCVFVKFELH